MLETTDCKGTPVLSHIPKLHDRDYVADGRRISFRQYDLQLSHGRIIAYFVDTLCQMDVPMKVVA